MGLAPESKLTVDGLFLTVLPRLDVHCVSGGLDKNQCVLNIDIVNIVCIASHIFLICMHVPICMHDHVSSNISLSLSLSLMCSGWK